MKKIKDNKARERNFSIMQASIGTEPKPAFKPFNYKPDEENLYNLFSYEWKRNSKVKRMWETRIKLPYPDYFAKEKNLTLIELMSLYFNDKDILSTIYELNMPRDAWTFAQWYYKKVSYIFLKEQMPQIPEFNKAKDMSDFLVRNKLTVKTYQLFKQLTAQQTQAQNN